MIMDVRRRRDATETKGIIKVLGFPIPVKYGTWENTRIRKTTPVSSVSESINGEIKSRMVPSSGRILWSSHPSRPDRQRIPANAAGISVT
jgi:hypothetical protein